MKKGFLFSAFFLALVLVLTGCAKSSQNANSAAKNNPNKPGQMRQPDFGQPERDPDIRGIVKSIIGNEVTVLKIDMPTGGRNASSTPEGGQNADRTPEMNSVVIGAGGASGPGGARGGAGGGMMMAGGGPGGPGGQDSETRAQMLARLKELSTGEEKVIIPVGIRMLKIDTGDGKRTMVEATLADITIDKNITVWTSTIPSDNSTGTTTDVSERKIAEFVLIN